MNRENGKGVKSRFAWRNDRRWGVLRADTATVAKINRSLDTDADPTQPEISEMIIVFDVARRLTYCVLVRPVNSHLAGRANVGTLIKLSDRHYAPYRASSLRLATPAYYRRKESVDSGFGDPNDGTLTMDATPWAREIVASSIANTSRSVSVDISTVTSTVMFASPEEPWIYCTSIAPVNSRETAQLRARFPRYDTATRIADPETFAVQLGIDFAIYVDTSRDVVISPVFEYAYSLSRVTTGLWEGERQVDKFVHVYHGPVHYEDDSGVLHDLEDVLRIGEAREAWFTKNPHFSDEREYRFALSVVGGRPREDIFDLAVSDEMRRLTARVK